MRPTTLSEALDFDIPVADRDRLATLRGSVMYVQKVSRQGRAQLLRWS
jgi:hypothetical protein